VNCVTMGEWEVQCIFCILLLPSLHHSVFFSSLSFFPSLLCLPARGRCRTELDCSPPCQEDCRVVWPLTTESLPLTRQAGHSSILLVLTLTFCQGQGDSSDDEEGSDSESDTRSYEHQQHAAARMSVSTVALCASCSGAGCGACVQLNCGWQETVRGHAIIRSLCQCCGAGCRGCCMPVAGSGSSHRQGADTALAVLADGEQPSENGNDDDGDVGRTASDTSIGHAAPEPGVLGLPPDQTEIWSEGLAGSSLAPRSSRSSSFSPNPVPVSRPYQQNVGARTCLVPTLFLFCADFKKC